MRLVGVIPAAGHATRLPGLVGSKEMISIGDRPVMDFLVERMRFSQPDPIRIVTRAAKTDLIRHSRSIGLEVIVAETTSAGHSIAAGVEGLEPDDIVLLGFPDTIFEPRHGFDLLIEALTPKVELALGLFTTSDPANSDVVVLDDGGFVGEIQVKPAAPASNLIWGCAVARCEMLSGIESYQYPGEHFQRMCRYRRVKGIWLSDIFIDVGTPDVLARLQSGDGLSG